MTSYIKGTFNVITCQKYMRRQNQVELENVIFTTAIDLCLNMYTRVTKLKQLKVFDMQTHQYIGVN